ncbi:MAG TPA: helix-turn-helix domain-containing protein [Pseudonocardiaceae bacterium]|nr:helix-turn-helix domain-containing protein [Pseudonocardiaceae bacterium]
MAERRKILGRRLRRARERLNLTQRDVADQIGVDAKSISNVERGSERVGIGGKLLNRYEDVVGWPEETIVRFMDTGDESAFEASATSRWPIEPLNDWERDTMTRLRGQADGFVRDVILAARNAGTSAGTSDSSAERAS